MESLRNRQIRDVLDVWKDVNRQVFEREKRQVAEFEEEVLPKKTSDVGVEATADGILTNLKKLLEAKLSSLESTIPNIAFKLKNDLSRPTFVQATTIGDFVALFNSYIRLIQERSLPRSSQELLKVKLIEIQQPLQAIIYGFERLIDSIFRYGQQAEVSKDMILLLQATAVYRFAKKEIDTNQYQLIDEGAIDSEYKLIVAEQSGERREIIADLLKREGKALREQVLRQVPTFIERDDMNRVQALEDEYGIRFPPELIKRASQQYNVADVNKLVSETEIDAKEQQQQQREYAKALVPLQRQLAAVERDYQKTNAIIEETQAKIKEYQESFERLKQYDPADPQVRNANASIKQRVLAFEDLLGKVYTRLDSLNQRRDQIQGSINIWGTLPNRAVENLAKKVSKGNKSQFTSPAKPSSSFAARGSTAPPSTPVTRPILRPFNIPDVPDEKTGEGRVERRGFSNLGDRYGKIQHDSSSDSDSDEDEHRTAYLARRNKALPYSEGRNEMYALQRR